MILGQIRLDCKTVRATKTDVLYHFINGKYVHSFIFHDILISAHDADTLTHVNSKRCVSVETSVFILLDRLEERTRKYLLKNKII